ncbi:MAG: translocation/assembly module TamB domain-containing protein [Deltaproteobacteria bacterium]|nr:translocation/assembly module TamB domain-containing protein [Deltaproteobacteria bacterium]
MKSRLRYVVFASVVLAGLVFALGWLLGTSSGARFLFGTVSHLFPLQIDVQKLDGRIIDKLLLHQTVLKSPQVEVQIDRLLIRWQPAYLLAGRITFQELDIGHVYIQDDRPESKAPPDLTFPKIHGLLTMVDVEIKSIRVAQMTYHRMNRAPVIMDTFSSRASWDRGILRLKHFRLETPVGWGEGTGELSFLTPALNFNLTFSPKESMLGLDQLSLNLNLRSGKSPEGMTGPLTMIGKSSSVERLRLTGNLGVTSDSLKLSHFVLSQFGRQGEVTLDGGVRLSTTEPFVNLRLKLKDVDFSKELIVAQKLTGELSLEGRPSAYSGLFAVKNSGPAWQVERLTGSIEGNLSRIKISNLDGSWLDGTLKGHLEMNWKQRIQFAGALQGRGLNPNRITPDWQGQINLNAQGELRLPEDRPLSGNLKIHLLESRLRGKALIGDIEAQVQEGRLFLSRAEFRGNGFNLSAHGELEKKLNVEVKITDLAGLIPGAQGSFFAKGWARWQNHQLAASLSGHGKNISLGKARMSALNVFARLGEDEKGLVDVKANVQELVYGSIHLDSLLMDATGTIGDHKVAMALYWPKGELRASLKGAYANGAWQGMVTHLSGKSPREVSWSLFSPFPVTLTHNKLHFGPLEIGSRIGQKVQILTDLSFRPIRGFVEANWKQLDLGLITPYLKKPHLAGHTTGKLRAEWLESNRLRLAASVDAAGTFHNDSIKLELSQTSLNFQWDEKGLQGSWKMVLAKEGQVDGQITSSQPARLSLPEQAIVMANWKAIDLSLLKAWLPRDTSLEAQCSGRLSGNWSRAGPFETQGEMKISQGTVRWKSKEIILSSTIQTVNFDWSWRHDGLRGKISLVLADYGDIKGKFQLPLNARLPVSIQKTGVLEVSVQGQIQENGLLATLFPSLILESRGTVDFNLNTTGTWAKPRFEAHLGIQKAGGRIHIAETSSKSKSAQNGGIQEKTFPLELARGSVRMNWDEKGLVSSWEAVLAREGSIHGTLASSQPARLAIPEMGKFDIRWERIDLTLLRSWLPPALALEGQLSGQLDGQWFEGLRLALKGKTTISKGFITWMGKDGSIRTELRNAVINLDWRGGTLAGEISIALEKFGQGQGKFLLPLLARLPPAIDPDGTVYLSLDGQVRESGLLTTLFPELVQESRGEVDLNIKVEGTWRKPSAQGRLKLTKAGAYLPRAGIHLKDMEAEAQFTGDRIHIVSFRTRSGPGHIEGRANFWMKEWRIIRYEGRLDGERFQTVYLPELRVLTNPHLDLEGTGERINVRGEILIPEGEFLGFQRKGVVRTSPDVVIVGPKKVSPSAPSFPLDARLHILLGDKVLFKAEGIDTRLVGSVTLQIRNVEEINANGEIQATEGHYSYYGQKLEMTRGRLLFDGPLENPTLDVLALRKIKGASRWEEQLREVHVGAVITGKLQSPVIRLYSQPSMSDADILSYLVLGQPATTSRSEEQTALLTKAASALLSAGGSVLAQSQFLGSLRIDTLDIQTGEDDISRSMVTIGKYLDPRLYVGLGGSLFTNTYQIILRYSLTKNIEIETKTGTQSGANVYFKIEFE